MPTIGQEPPPIIWYVAAGLLAVLVVIPFGGREDWLGWVAFLTMTIVLAGVMGLLIWRAFQSD